MAEFAAALQELKAHHITNLKEGKRRPFLASDHVRTLYASNSVAASAINDNKDIVGLQMLAQDLGQQESDDNRTAISTSTENLQSAGATPVAQNDFIAQLEERRKKAQEQAINNVNRIYDEAARIGEEHPDLQPHLLTTLDVVSKLFQDLFDRLADFISGVVKKVAEWLDQAWKTIKDTFNMLTSWISHWF